MPLRGRLFSCAVVRQCLLCYGDRFPVENLSIFLGLFPAVSALGKRFCSSPALDSTPPQQPLPFIQASLGPLPVGPPQGSELRLIPRPGDREGLPTDLVAKNAQRPAGVDLRRGDQIPPALFALQAFFRILRF